MINTALETKIVKELDLQEVEAADFYRTIFPKGSLEEAGNQQPGKYNAMVYAVLPDMDTAHILHMHDDLALLNEMRVSDASMNCVSYAGKEPKEDYARYLHAFFVRVNLSTHTLNYRKQEDGHCRHYVEFLPKTQAGIRSIPMFDEVRTALLEEKERQDRVGTADTVIDGVSGWVFTNRDGTVFKEKNINDAIERIYKAYNASEQEAAEREGREPFLLPHFTCHQLRKTFCTRLCESENRPKIVQAVMGHANISTTMDVYAEVEERAKKEAIVQLQGTVFIK